MGGASVPRKALKKSPAMGAPASPGNRGASAPRLAVPRRPPDEVARRAAAQPAPVDNPKQSGPLQAPERPADVAAVQPGAPGDVVVRGPRRPVPGVPEQDEPNGNLLPAQVGQGEVNEPVQHREA